MGKFPIAAYASTLSERQLHAFIHMPLLRHDPLKAIDIFEAKFRRRVR